MWRGEGRGGARPKSYYGGWGRGGGILGHELTRNDKNKAHADRKCHTSWAS